MLGKSVCVHETKQNTDRYFGFLDHQISVLVSVGLYSKPKASKLQGEKTLSFKAKKMYLQWFWITITP